MTGSSVTEGPRRYLIATAVDHYSRRPEWDLPGATDSLEQVTKLFTETLGYRLDDAPRLNPTRIELLTRLREFCRSSERRDDDVVTVYLTGHGHRDVVVGDRMLLLADTAPDDIDFTALPVSELLRVMLSGTRVRNVLLLLDTCYSAEKLGPSARFSGGLDMRQTPPDGTLAIISSQWTPHDGGSGRFSKLLARAVDSQAVGGSGPLDLSIAALVAQMNKASPRAIELAMAGLDGTMPSFFPNPRHRSSGSVDLLDDDSSKRETRQRVRRAEFARFLAQADMPGGISGHTFVGRRAALRDLASWLTDSDSVRSSRCCVVTAGPGSGKTTLLGRVAVMAIPEWRLKAMSFVVETDQAEIPLGTVDAAVYAHQLSDNDVLELLAAAADTASASMPSLVDALHRHPRRRPLTVLIDALDEAATPESLCARVLQPLLQQCNGRLRLLLGTRRNLLPKLGLDTGHIIDLDDPRYADPEALRYYTLQRLMANPESPYARHPESGAEVADAIARAAENSFLVARIIATTVAADSRIVSDPSDPQWLAGLPRFAEQAIMGDLNRRLGSDAHRAIDLMRPLAFALGRGLPWEDIWAPLANAISGRDYSDEDVAWLRQVAGAYVAESQEAGRSVYRPFHNSLSELLRDEVNETQIQTAFTKVLTGRVPQAADGAPDWSRAHPYILSHLADHAARAGLLDSLLADGNFLVFATPAGLVPQLHRARTEAGRLAAAIYRGCLVLHGTTSPAVRRQILASDAGQAGAESLRRELTKRAVLSEEVPQWVTATASASELRETFMAHIGQIQAVACTALEGGPIAVTGTIDHLVHVWNLRTGQKTASLTGHTDGITAIACTDLASTPIAITGSADCTARIWDLSTGRQLRQFMGHTGVILAVACAVVEGRPVAVTSSVDRTVQVWDLRTGIPINSLTGNWGGTTALACSLVDGRSIAVTGGIDRKVCVWDLSTGRQLRQFTGHTGAILAVACAVIDNRTVAVTGGIDRTVRVWDLSTGEQLASMSGHTDAVQSVACILRDGLPVLVTGSVDGTVRFWDLLTGDPLGEPVSSCASLVWAVATDAQEVIPLAALTARHSASGAWSSYDIPAFPAPSPSAALVSYVGRLHLLLPGPDWPRNASELSADAVGYLHTNLLALADAVCGQRLQSTLDLHVAAIAHASGPIHYVHRLLSRYLSIVADDERVPGSWTSAPWSEILRRIVSRSGPSSLLLMLPVLAEDARLSGEILDTILDDEDLFAASAVFLGTSNKEEMRAAWRHEIEVWKQRRLSLVNTLSNMRFLTVSEDALASARHSMEKFANMAGPELRRETDELALAVHALARYARADTFQERKEALLSTELHVDKVRKFIRRAPTAVSVEALDPAASGLASLAQRLLRDLGLAHPAEPQLSPALEDAALAHGVLTLQVLVSNAVGSAPAEAPVLRFSAVPGSRFEPAQTEMHLGAALESGTSRVIVVRMQPVAEAAGSAPHVTQSHARVDATLSYKQAAGGEIQTLRSRLGFRIVSPRPPSKQIRNPFITGATGMPVTSDTMFFGRDELIDKIRHRIKTSEGTGTGVALFGQRRSGKSSIRLHLVQRLRKLDGLSVVDIGNIGDLTPAPQDRIDPTRLLAVLVWRIIEGADDQVGADHWLRPRALAREQFLKSPDPVYDCVRLFRDFRRRYPDAADFVVCIDEFQYVGSWIKDGIVPGEFLRAFKALMERDLFHLVIVGQSDIEQLIATDPNVFKVFAIERVGYLDEASALRLIEQPIRHGDRSRYRHGAARRILELSGRHAFYIQRLCSDLVDRMNDMGAAAVTEADVEEVAAAFIDQVSAAADFDGLESHGVDGFTPAQYRAAALAVARAAQTGPATFDQITWHYRGPYLRQLLKDLVGHEVLRYEAGKYVVTVGMYQRWLLDRPEAL